MGKKVLIIILMLLFSPVLVGSPAIGKKVLRYSSSAQIHEAIGQEVLAAFKAETGIEIDLYVGASDSAVHRLINNFSDIASTIVGIGDQVEKNGYIQTDFCRAPMIVITNVKIPVTNISTSQLRDIFSGIITNWKELGGPDKEIIVIIPGRHTGTFKNFSRLALGQTEVKYDFITYKSTDVLMLVKRIPWSISFISRSARTSDAELRMLNVDNLSPDDLKYPYSQTFSFVTREESGVLAKKFIDFAFSEKAGVIMKKIGLKPLAR